MRTFFTNFSHAISAFTDHPIKYCVVFLPLLVCLDLLRPAFSAIPLTIYAITSSGGTLDTEDYIIGSLIVIAFMVLFMLMLLGLRLFLVGISNDGFAKLRRRRRKLYLFLVAYYFFVTLAYNPFFSDIFIRPLSLNFSILTSPIPDSLILAISAMSVLIFSRDRGIIGVQRRSATEQEPEAQVGEPTARLLRERARKARVSAGTAIFFVVALLVLASGLVWSTVIDTNVDAPVSEVERARVELNDLEQSRLEIQNTILRALPKEISIGSVIEGKRLDTLQTRQAIRAWQVDTKGRDTDEEFLRHLQSLESIDLEIDIGQRRLTEIAADDTTEIGQREAYIRLAQSVLVRITLVVLILFLVRLLFNLYRYLTRIAAAYDSKADAIDLVSFDPDKLTKLVDAFSTEQFDFGKTPTGPVDQATEIIRAVNGISKTGEK